MGVSCPAVPAAGTFPDDYSKLLPKGVPPVQRQPTSFQISGVTKNGKLTFPTIGPADTTWYFPIPLDKTNPTGVFIPQGFKFANEVDVILFFHGNKQGWSQISDYWQGDVKGIRLREDVNDSNRNVLLVAPTMGDAPGQSWTTSDVGIFKNPGMGDCFLTHVMAWLGNYEPRFNKKAPSVRKIILAGHSGGGVPIHHQKVAMKAKLCEIWSFDTVVTDMDGWVTFAGTNPQIKMTFFQAVQFSYSSFVAAKEKGKATFGNLDNLQLIDTKNHTLAGHYPAMTKNFGDMVTKANCLARR
jgi:hypothetical protein